MRKGGLVVSDIFVIFYYDIFHFKKSILASLDIKMHSLCTWKNILNIIKKDGMIPNNDIKSLELFLSNPEKWRESYG